MIYYYIVGNFGQELYWIESENDWTENRDDCTLFDDEDDANAFADMLKPLDVTVEQCWKVKK